MRRPSGKTPYPWHVILSHPQVGKAKLLLAPDQAGALVTRHRHTGLENVTPTDFAYGSQSPFTRRTSVFKRLVMGMGQPVEIEQSSQRYDHAIGMDWACGLGALATEWVPPITVGSGPIKSIENLTIGTTRYLCVLSGNGVYVGTAASIMGSGDLPLLRDFGPPPPPPAPTWDPTSGTGTEDYWYCLRTSGVGPPATSNFGPPISAVGAVLDVPNAPNTINSGNQVKLTWPHQAGGVQVVVYRSHDHGLTWYYRNAGFDAVGLNDDDTLWIGPGTLPLDAAIGQVPTQLLAAAPQGRTRLFVGVESGGFWAWDGSAWQQNANDGRVLAMEGFEFLVGSAWDRTHTNTYPMNYVLGGTLEPMTFVGGWPSLPGSYAVRYQDEHPSDLTRIVRLNGTLFVFAQNRIAVGTSPTVTELTPDRGLPSNPHNGRTACVWQGSVYTAFGMGLYKLTPTSAQSASIEPVGLERLVENSSEVQGRIVALAPWSSWHLWWAAWDQRTNVSYVGKYGAWLNPEASRDPQAQMVGVMHGALEKWVGRQASWLQTSTIGEPSGNGRLYLGFTDGGLTWTILPGQTPFAPTDPYCRFRPTGYTVLSRHSAGFQADDKNYFDLTAFGPLVSGHQRTTFSYQLPGDTDWRAIPGKVLEGGEPLVFPSGALGKWLQLRVQLETDDPTESPVLEGVALGEQLRPSSIEEIAFTAHVGPRLLRRDGHITRVSARELHDLLRQFEARGDDVEVLLPDGELQRAAITDFTDRYLEGSTTAGPRHDLGVTLLTFKTVS